MLHFREKIHNHLRSSKVNTGKAQRPVGEPLRSEAGASRLLQGGVRTIVAEENGTHSSCTTDQHMTNKILPPRLGGRPKPIVRK